MQSQTELTHFSFLFASLSLGTSELLADNSHATVGFLIVSFWPILGMVFYKQFAGRIEGDRLDIGC